MNNRPNLPYTVQLALAQLANDTGGDKQNYERKRGQHDARAFGLCPQLCVRGPAARLSGDEAALQRNAAGVG